MTQTIQIWKFLTWNPSLSGKDPEDDQRQNGKDVEIEMKEIGKTKMVAQDRVGNH